MLELNEINNPFPGIRPFEMDETNLFFGRDGQSDELLKRMQRSRLLAVVGTSGSGKSSLIRAGLLPALYGGLMGDAGSSWRIAIQRPGGDPIGNLALALADPLVFGSESDAEIQTALIETTLRRSSIGLIDVARQARMSAHENLLVVVDQFEELFRFKRAQSGDDATAFVKLLLEASAQREIPIYIIITMRSDFLGDCSQFTGLPEAINDGQYLIPRMSRDERKAAIVGPIAVGEGEISRPLVSRLLNDVGDNPDQLPILQHALMRTWEYWAGHRRNGKPIDLEDYTAIGTMADALSLHADEAFDELPGDRSRLIAEKLFKRLTEKGTDNREIRRPTPLAELAAVCEATEAEVGAVIDVFRGQGRSFLMPPIGTKLTSETVVDISHESLIRNWQRLQQWVNEEAQSSRTYRRLAEAAALHREGREGLLQDPGLQIALDWFEKNNPNAAWAQRYHAEFDEAKKYLEESCEAREDALRERERLRNQDLERERSERERAEMYAAGQARAARRLRALMIAMAALFVLALATAAFAVKSRSTAVAALADAQTERERARAAEQTALADKKDLAAALRVKEQAERATEQAEKAKDAALQTAVTERRRAEARAREALALQAIAVKQKNEILLAAATNDKFREASVLTQRGQYDEAKSGFESALAGYQQLKRDEAVADTHLGIGDAEFTSAYDSFLAMGSDFTSVEDSSIERIRDAIKHYNDAATKYAANSPQKAGDTLMALGARLLQFTTNPEPQTRGQKSENERSANSSGLVKPLPDLSQNRSPTDIVLPPAFFERGSEAVQSLRIEFQTEAVKSYNRAADNYIKSYDRSLNRTDGTKSEIERRQNVDTWTARKGVADANLQAGNVYRDTANEIEAAGPAAEPEFANSQRAAIKENRLGAIRFYESLLKNRQPPDTDEQLGSLLIWLAGLYFEVGDEVNANKYFARVLHAYAISKNPPKEADVLFASAEVLDSDGEVTAAAEYFAKALAQYTSDGKLDGQAKASYRLGRIYEDGFQRGWAPLAFQKYEQSLAAYQKIPSSLDKNSVDALFHMGAEWEKTGEYKQALAAYRLAAQAKSIPKDMEARVNDQVGNVLSVMGETEEAIEVYERARLAFQALGTNDGKAESVRIGRIIEALKIALSKTPTPKSKP
jgi:hypothetical protein